MQFIISALSFLGPFILFFQELIVSSSLLPYFGGSSMVWISCTLAYTFLMLIGYIWIQFSARFFKLKNYLIVHFILLILSFVHLYFNLDLFVISERSSNPVFWVTLLTIGPSFLMLSMTTSLMQFLTVNMRGSSHEVFNIFSVSNIGSILSLILFPIFFEYYFSYETLFLIIKSLFCGYFIIFLLLIFKQYEDHFEKVDLKIEPKIFFIWVFCSFTGVLLLLSVTNFISVGLGANSLLWSIPMIIYLLSFVITFSKRNLYSSNLIVGIIFLWLGIHLLSIYKHMDYPFLGPVAYYLFLLLSTVVVHKYLFNIRPEKLSNVVSYNVAINLGGVLASFFVIFVIPKFTTVTGNIYAELFWGIVSYLAVLLLRDYKTIRNIFMSYGKIKKVFVILMIPALFIIVLKSSSDEKNIYFKRNYYGRESSYRK